MKERSAFMGALDIDDPTQRAEFLDAACAGDSALRQRVEALLKSHFGAGNFLGKLAPERLAEELALQATQGERDSLASDTAQDELGFLKPTTRPGALGRLGHYELLEVLGRGGFGIVFRGFDEVLHRVVAVKVLAPQLAVCARSRQRFLREARASARVRHENIVQVYAVEEQPLPYLVMEFIPGETLQRRLERTGPLPTREVLHLGRQIAEGLAAAHASGLIHRDIKPANILLEGGTNPRVKITDFGLARAADDASLTQTGILAGTPLFMAPEQAKGEPLDRRADLFSLGSVLYTMCSGRPPFRANTTLAVLKRVVEDTPQPLREISPEVLEWQCDLIARLHAKKPEDRFASAQEVVDLLGSGLRALEQGSVPSFPGVAPGAGKQVRRGRESQAQRGPRVHAGAWVIAAALLLLLLGGFGLAEATGVTDVHGTVIRLFWPEGTLVVEVNDPGVSVKIEGSDLVITGTGAKEIRLRPGSYTVEARKGDKIVSRELITVVTNGRQVVRVSQEAAAAKTAEEKARSTGAGKLPPTFQNRTGMEFVLVPRGKGWLGGGKDMLGEKEVEIAADFYLGKYEVTQEEWQKVMGENPSSFSRKGHNSSLVKNIDDADLKRFPVEMVSWHQCRIFVEKLNRRERETGWVYRLPTEVEWEYACRGGPMADKLDSAFDFYFARPTNAPVTAQANFNNGLNRPCKVGSYPPNTLGLHDMHGNVWEWCDDTGRAPNGVYRGGDWLSDAVHCRAAFFFVYPTSHRDTRLGLRVARVRPAS
jgi:formylglycine-generating enzyme required for sulfatase activity